MKFEKIAPVERLRPYISHFVISENDLESTYKVFPTTALVIGFQYAGQLNSVTDHTRIPLSTSGITGISDQPKIFQNTANTNTILVYFTETGLACFSSCPAHELFNQSVSLEHIFDRHKISEAEDKLSSATTDRQRIAIIERFLLTQLKDIQQDKLVIEAVKMIHQSNGTVRVSELNERLAISPSPFEKRFRKLVGTSPKKFSSIVRFNTVLSQVRAGKPLADICYENDFFDQAHFTKDFHRYTGESPDTFRRHS